MKKLFIVIALLMAFTQSYAQAPNGGGNLPLTTKPTNPEDAGGKPAKSPVLVPSVYQDGHTLYLYSGCTGATLRLLDADEEEVFSTEITDEMDEICIPSTLIGTYRLEIIRGAFTFYCYIEL